MIRLAVKYNGRTIKTFKCEGSKLNEGIAYLVKKYPQCTVAIYN